MVNHIALMLRKSDLARAETQKMIADCFEAAIMRVGATEAKRMWGDAAKSKGGKPRGPTNRFKRRDAELVALYDEWVLIHSDEKSRRMAVSSICEYLSKKFPGEYGANATAIGKQLRRLLQRRKHQRPGSWNAMAVLARTGKLPEGQPPWNMDK